MKRTATLVAGLLLVTGTVFASELKVTGATVEGTFNLVNTQAGALGSDGGDLNLKLEASKEGTYGKVGVAVNFNKANEDNNVKLTYEKTEGDWTVATSAKVIEARDGDATNGNQWGGTFSLKMNEGSDTYIKWNVMGSKKVTLTYYPWEVDGFNWDKDTFEAFAGMSTGGLKVGVKVNDTTDFAVKYATQNGGNETKNFPVIRGEFNTKVAGISIGLAGATGTKSASTYELKVGDKSIGTSPTQTELSKNFFGAQVTAPFGKLTVKGEALVENITGKVTGKEDLKVTKQGLFGKVSYELSKVKGYAPTPYALLKNVSGEVKDMKAGKETYTKIEAGVELKNGSFSVTPKFISESYKEFEVFKKEDSLKADKT